MKKIQIFSLGLAMSLMMSQTAQAAGTIMPFGTVTAQEQGVPQAPGENNVVSPNTSSAEFGPGKPEHTETSVVQISASYSTTEPVMISSGTLSDNPTVPSNAGVTNGRNMTSEEIKKEAEQRNISIPEIAAEGAVLYDVTHDTFVYEKNADQKFYPASITKILTALLVLEHADLNETVTFSKNAVTNLESGAVTLKLQEGDRVSVKDCLYGLMLKSANEVANGLAEHVGGSIDHFLDMMNEKAAALGCTNSHFVNPNGLNHTEHYTTARDMAKIAKAAFANETLCKISSTTSYQFPATKAAGERTITMGHKMLYSSDSRYYSGIIGGKTGYTSLAGNTLVTCTERDGVRMVAVILKSRSTHYSDTKALLDYGYELNQKGLFQESESQKPTVSADQLAKGPGMELQTVYHKWTQDGEFWYFDLADGTRLSNCFVLIDGKEYAFDTEGKMVTGWLTLGANWHYFGNSGAMIKNDWRQDAGLWFYLGADGAMMKNTWIDQQYYVGEDGVWVN